MRGILKGARCHARTRTGMSRTTVTDRRHLLPANGEPIQPDQRVSDPGVEADELFQNAGKKVTKPSIPLPHRAAERINAADGARMLMIVRPCWG